MKNLKSVFVFTLLLACGICQDTTTVTTASTNGSSTTSVDTTTTEIKSDTTTVSTASSLQTTPKPTTQPPTKPTTQPPTKPTTQPPTTTQSTVTTTQSTTSIAPSTTTEPPTPELTEWNVTDGNLTCIRADLKARFKIPIEGGFEYIYLSPNSSIEGSKCNATNGTQLLELTDSDYKFSMTFAKDGDSKTFVKKIEFVYSLPPNIMGTVSNETAMFNVPTGSSYLCHSGNIDLQNVTMEIMHIQLRSFGDKENLDFGTVEQCDADNKVNDLVPIVVGCALLALVVIVLIAYFVGRRRSRQKGYQSV